MQVVLNHKAFQVSAAVPRATTELHQVFVAVVDQAQQESAAWPQQLGQRVCVAVLWQALLVCGAV